MLMLLMGSSLSLVRQDRQRAGLSEHCSSYTGQCSTLQTSTSWRHPLPQVVNLAGVREPSTHRRLFAAEMVSSGLRLHIIATLLGHLDLETTRGYTAIFSEEVVAARQQFIERRRATRSGAELRTATGEEWAEFENHLLRRKISPRLVAAHRGDDGQRDRTPRRGERPGLAR